MEKLIQAVGIVKWHGNEAALLQSEPLYAIEQFVRPYGACVLQGCQVTPNLGNVDIAPGLISIKHPVDGWQICRFAGVVGGTVIGHIRITKATTNKGTQLAGAQPRKNSYTATYHAGAGALGADEFINVVNNTDQIVTFAQKLGESARAGWTNVFTGSFVGAAPGSYTIDMQYDKLSKMLHIRGFFILAAGTGYALTNLASVPTEFIPPVTSHIPCTAGGGDFTSAGAQPVLYLVLASGGNLSLQLIKPTVSDMPYQIDYSLFIG